MSEICQTEKDKYYMILLKCGIPSLFLKKDTNKLIYKTKTDSQKEKQNLSLFIHLQTKLGRGINSKFWINIYILLYINIYNNVQSIYKYR